MVNQPSGQWIAAIAVSRSQAPIDLLDNITLTPVQNAGNQWTFTIVLLVLLELLVLPSYRCY